MILEIPFTSDGAQTFSVQLGSVKYQFSANFNERASAWYLDIADPTTLAPIVSNVAIVLGANLLAPFNLGIGSLIANNEDASLLDAGPDDLGTRVKVYWFSPDEVPA